MNDNKGSFPCWEKVCDDALLQILSFLDVTSAVRLLLGTNHVWCKRSHDLTTKYPELWRVWYDRLGYSPAKLCDCNDGADVLASLIDSHRLAKNLMGRSTSTKSKWNCFSLPNRCFSFLPVAPDDDMTLGDNDDDDDDSFLMQDPPPVSFDCESFLLTGQGTEFVLLNPFTLTLTVHKSVLDSAFHSDEGMMEKAWRAASHRIVEQRHQNNFNNNSDDAMQQDDDDDEVEDDHEYLLAADAIHETLHRNHYARQPLYRVDPQQTLVDLADSMNLRLQDYFPSQRELIRHPLGIQHNQLEEYELSYGGIDAKSVWKDGVLIGTLLAAGRIISKLDPNDVNEECCWEVLTWYKGHDEDYGHPKSCRIRGACNTLDVCPYEQVVYVNFCRQDDNNNWDADDNIFMLWAGQRQIKVLPLTDDGMDACQTRPVAEWICQHPVTALVACSGNTVLVGTNARTLELYKRTSNSAILQKVVSIPSAVKEALEQHGRPAEPLHPSPITDILCAKDFPLQKVGFWTFQHSSAHGTTVLLWKCKIEEDGNDNWVIETILRLPLSGQRTPKLLYDGRRLLVYGQDHIGMILLVYHVRNSNEDCEAFEEVSIGTEESGGVVNVGQTAPMTRFANRIRHVGLGGIENALYEALYMSANERFVILNTKNGNLLSGSSTPYREGLLVIDLQDQDSF